MCEVTVGCITLAITRPAFCARAHRWVELSRTVLKGDVLYHRLSSGERHAVTCSHRSRSFDHGVHPRAGELTSSADFSGLCRPVPGLDRDVHFTRNRIDYLLMYGGLWLFKMSLAISQAPPGCRW
jgi:hypothetical protein